MVSFTNEPCGVEFPTQLAVALGREPGFGCADTDSLEAITFAQGGALAIVRISGSDALVVGTGQDQAANQFNWRIA